MKNARILFISPGITPYVPSNEIANITRYLPQKIKEKGKEIRTFMPRYGCINERRHQLHEVIRLSGMNIIIDGVDHPLVIKVASIQPARIQVYFIDNEEYFSKKHILNDASGKLIRNNDERAIFFSRGIMETMKRLEWSPDLIHCHGWFTSLIPLYLKCMYKDDPVFANTKVVYSVYNDGFKDKLNKNFASKIKDEQIPEQDYEKLSDPTHVNMIKTGLDMADGIICGSESIDSEIESYMANSNKPVLDYQGDEFAEAYNEFYDEILVGEPAIAE